jgi:hypothetical protein
MTAIATHLLSSSFYFERTDSEQLVLQHQFWRGFAAGMLLGWIGTFTVLAAQKLGVLP